MQLLIGRIAFLTCGKSDTRHLIGLHRFANENLLCGFSVCKSQYVYNKTKHLMTGPRETVSFVSTRPSMFVLFVALCRFGRKARFDCRSYCKHSHSSIKQTIFFRFLFYFESGGITEHLNTERSYITRLRCSACQSQIPMLPFDWLIHSSLIGEFKKLRPRLLSDSRNPRFQ